MLKRKEQRQQKVRLRKNFLPTLILNLGLWFGVVSIVYYVDPERPGALILFFVTLLSALFFTLATVFLNSRRGFLASLVICVFLVLRYIGIGSPLQFGLLIAVFLTIEYYFSSLK